MRLVIRNFYTSHALPACPYSVCLLLHAGMIRILDSWFRNCTWLIQVHVRWRSLLRVCDVLRHCQMTLGWCTVLFWKVLHAKTASFLLTCSHLLSAWPEWGNGFTRSQGDASCCSPLATLGRARRGRAKQISEAQDRKPTVSLTHMRTYLQGRR